jgi:release factor glutamine methyltransferase
VDLIAANPPYVPGEDIPSRGPARAWEGGPDGRRLLDRLIATAPDHLRPGGRLMVVHSSVCDLDLTVQRMSEVGLEAKVVARHRGGVGPLVAARATMLEQRGLLARGERVEEMAVICGRR